MPQDFRGLTCQRTMPRACGVVFPQPHGIQEALGFNSHWVCACWLGASKACKLQAAAECCSGKCISRESNPGHIDGNDVFYH